MPSYNEIGYDILEILNNSNISDDEDISIEHILPDDGTEQNGKIGNLLPLSSNINQNCGDEDFQKKIEKYKNSNFKTVKDFLEFNSSKIEWTTKDINDRTETLAKLSYERIWKIL
jgi:hypothetical protein